MRLEQHLILAILIGVTKSLKITRFDLLQYQYQKPLNQNQSLTVEKYLQDLQEFRHDLNFVEKAIDAVYESQQSNQTSLDIGKFQRLSEEIPSKLSLQNEVPSYLLNTLAFTLKFTKKNPFRKDQKLQGFFLRILSCKNL